MPYFTMVIGLLAALALLSAGLILLPAPDLESVPGIFTSIWLIIALISLISFGTAVSRRERLNRYRDRHRYAARSGISGGMSRRKPATTARELPVRERERRLD